EPNTWMMFDAFTGSYICSINNVPAGSSWFGRSNEQITIDLFSPAMFGGLILLFILALELKDKMYARTELEEGRAVQISLMPEVNPDVKGWDIWLFTKPANDVGGDLIDFLKISENKIGISVGDVAGKGLSAALLMAKLQSTIRAIAPDYISLSTLGEKLNRIFCRDSLPKLFASLVYTELNIDSGEVKILNAGHLEPLIIKESAIKKINKSSPALGIIQDATFNEQVTNLGFNEYLIIFSDGLTEARNESGEFFGEERLKSFLSAAYGLTSQQLGNKILFEVHNFTVNAKVHDDLTIAILRRKELKKSL
ncbi:MAG: PP2C family protein-serine/threonine phosphatase, partial [Ignavibacteriaceae bacterium]